MESGCWLALQSEGPTNGIFDFTHLGSTHLAVIGVQAGEIHAVQLLLEELEMARECCEA